MVFIVQFLRPVEPFVGHYRPMGRRWGAVGESPQLFYRYRATMALMKPERLVGELCLLAERLGLEVRRESLDGAPQGGLCVLRGRAMVLLDESLPATDQAEVLAAALAQAGHVSPSQPQTAADLESLYILPEVRQYLDRFADES